MKKFMWLAGPCVIESKEMILDIAPRLKEIAEKLGLDFYFKSSFDKANRTSISSFRGPGIEKGLDILFEAKQKYGVKLVTDIHEPWQAAKAAEVVDIIQIPAFLCRQTDLLVAAAKTGKIINVKKAQFLEPKSMQFAAKKIEESGNNKIMLCERGTSFGYGNLVVDMTGLVEMRKLGYPVIFDATHSVQKPGGLTTGGNREYVKYLSRAAASVGIDGLFTEVHVDPDSAKSDGPNMIPLSQTEQLLDEILKIRNIIGDNNDK